jgi:hypothetical protein
MVNNKFYGGSYSSKFMVSFMLIFIVAVGSELLVYLVN